MAIYSSHQTHLGRSTVSLLPLRKRVGPSMLFRQAFLTSRRLPQTWRLSVCGRYGRRYYAISATGFQRISAPGWPQASCAGDLPHSCSRPSDRAASPLFGNPPLLLRDETESERYEEGRLNRHSDLPPLRRQMALRFAQCAQEVQRGSFRKKGRAAKTSELSAPAAPRPTKRVGRNPAGAWCPLLVSFTGGQRSLR